MPSVGEPSPVVAPDIPQEVVVETGPVEQHEEGDDDDIGDYFPEDEDGEINTVRSYL